jgi:hypothetical protein
MRAPNLTFARGLLVVSVLLAGEWACQAPDAYFRLQGPNAGVGGSHAGGSGMGGSGDGGSGMGGHGTGGASMGGSGMGGHGMGGASMGGSGMGGHGMGGASMGGHGMGGAGMGGVTGMGGAGMGGVTGSGGTIDAGVDAGTGGATGTGPCAGLCDSPTVFTTAMYNSTNLGATATCHETTAGVTHAVCGNFTTKTLSINGVAQSCPDNGSTTITLSSIPPVHGGYCFQSTAGDHPWAYFQTY